MRYRSIIKGLNSFVKRQTVIIAKKATPYLNPRYWAVYLVAFAAGFYLFGPAHGWHKLYRVNPERKMTREEPQSMVALQRELRLIKQDLKRLTPPSPNESQFTPDQFIRPVSGDVVQGYQWTVLRHVWRLHPGVDFQVPFGSTVTAAAAGRVVCCERSSHGFTIKINHGNAWMSVYIDLKAVRVQNGQVVLQGQAIGVSGFINCTKPERAGFHFGLYHNDAPVDPRKIISGI